MQVNCLFDNIGRWCLDAIFEGRVTFQKDVVKKIFLIFFLLDDTFCDYLTGGGTEFVKIRVIEFENCLTFEPAEADEETKNDASAVVGVGGGVAGEGDDFAGDDFGVRACYLGLFEFAGDGGFDEVLETEGNYGYSKEWLMMEKAWDGMGCMLQNSDVCIDGMGLT